MGERKGRGLPTVEPQGIVHIDEPPKIKVDTQVVINVPAQPIVDGPTRWLFQVSATVLKGYFYGTEAQARELDDKLRADARISSGVYLRRMERQAPTDYTTVESVLADVELAIPSD